MKKDIVTMREIKMTKLYIIFHTPIRYHRHFRAVYSPAVLKEKITVKKAVCVLVVCRYGFGFRGITGRF